jgi:hypothetical protein
MAAKTRNDSRSNDIDREAIQIVPAACLAKAGVRSAAFPHVWHEVQTLVEIKGVVKAVSRDDYIVPDSRHYPFGTLFVC